MTGWLMAGMGVGAIAGSAWAGARAHGIAPVRGLRTSVLLFAVFCIDRRAADRPVDDRRDRRRLDLLRPGTRSSISRRSTSSGPAGRPGRRGLGSLWMIEGTAAAAETPLAASSPRGPALDGHLVIASVIVFASPAIFTVGIGPSWPPPRA
ncbi:MAG: hypothetical protein U0R65_02160 [Candidatus Nanopelagicales bacterium]